MSKISPSQPTNNLSHAWLSTVGHESQPSDLPQRYKFTLEQYHQLGETGIINPDIRMELIRGELILMAAKGTPHEVCLTRLIRVLLQAVGQQAFVRVQNARHHTARQ